MPMDCDRLRTLARLVDPFAELCGPVVEECVRYHKHDMPARLLVALVKECELPLAKSVHQRADLQECISASSATAGFRVQGWGYGSASYLQTLAQAHGVSKDAPADLFLREGANVLPHKLNAVHLREACV